MRACDNKYQYALIHRNFKWRKINIKLNDLAKFQYYDKIEVGNNQLTKSEDQYEEEEELG